MKKLSFILTILLMLVLCGCGKVSNSHESTVMTIERLKELYSEDTNNIDLACKLIEALLLNDSKVEAYETLRFAQEKTNSIDDIKKLKQFCQFLPIRLVEVDYFDEDGKQYDAKLYRYDENGRVVSNGDETFFYPDDGGDVYYYTLSSWYDSKKSYDKNDVLLLEESPSYIFKYYHDYDEQGRVIKLKSVKNFTYSENANIRTEEYEFDARGNLIKKSITVSQENNESKTFYSYSYEYDEHDSVVRSVYKRADNGDYNEEKYQNEYNEFGLLIRRFGYEKNKETNDYYEIMEENYEYDPLYEVIIKKRDREMFFTSRTNYIYELVDSNSKYVGLPSEEMVAFVSGEATKAVINRKIIADKIKIRSTPTTKENNQIGTARKDEIYKVYNSVYNDGYAWHEIGNNQWIADDGTWTKEVE